MAWYRLLGLLSTAISVVLAEDAIAAADIPARPLDPTALPTSIAKCSAINRKTGLEKTLEIHYVDINPSAKKTLLMVHGWPSLWHSWKYQIEEFKNTYRIIAPDLRGFGESTHPGDVESSSNMSDLVGDLTCVLTHAGVDKAACIGHDWGSQVCYEAARERPDIFEAIIATCIPYIPYTGPFVPIAELVPTLPKLAYNVYFDNSTHKAITELNTDIRRTLRATLRSAASPPPDLFLQQTDSYLRGWDEIQPPPIPFFTIEEEDYWVKQYEIQGFNYTLYFYTRENKHASWAFVHEQGNYTIPQPTLSILATEDLVADWVLAAKLLKSAEMIPNLTTETVAAAHWLQLERPDEVNAIMRKWLAQWYPPVVSEASAQHSTKAEADHTSHARDEL